MLEGENIDHCLDDKGTNVIEIVGMGRDKKRMFEPYNLPILVVPKSGILK